MKKTTKESAPAGMAWVKGNQKPFYDPRIIKKGQNKGKIQGWVLKKVNNYKQVILAPEEIASVNPPWDKYLAQQKEFFKTDSNDQ